MGTADKAGRGYVATNYDLGVNPWVYVDYAWVTGSEIIPINTDEDNGYDYIETSFPSFKGSNNIPEFFLVFLSDLPEGYSDDPGANPGWPLSAAGASNRMNQYVTGYVKNSFDDSRPYKTGKVENMRIPVPAGTKYVKACWYTETGLSSIETWDGPEPTINDFYIRKVKSGTVLSLPKQIINTQVYYDAMNNEATTLDDGHVSTLKDTRFVIVLPKNYSHTGKPSKVLMVCHGGTGEVRADGYWYPGDQADMYDTMNMFRENGYVIFDVDRDTNSANQCYGSPVMLEAYYNAFKYIRENYNVEDKLNIYAMSMGTNTAFNFVNLYRPLVKAVLITGPRTGVAFDDFTNMSAGTLENFGATAEDIEQKFYPFNILGQIITLPDGQDTIKTVTRNVPPTKIIALLSDKDGSQWTDGYDDVAEALHNAGNFVVVRTVDTSLSHAELCHLSAEALRTEAIDWFNKYGK